MIPALVRRTKMPSYRASSATLPGSISNAFLAVREAAVGGVPDQRLVALLQLLIEAAIEILDASKIACLTNSLVV